MNIAVFVFAYPVLSETFVINELYQLQQAGVKGVIWREKSGSGGAHQKATKLQFPVQDCPGKILGLSIWPILKGHCWWFVHYPLRYVKLLWEILFCFPDKESLKIFVKAVIPAQQVYASGSQLVYVHESDRAYVFGLCAARLCSLPIIIIFHTYFLFVEKRYIQQKVKSASAVIFQSAYSKNIVAELIHRSELLLQKLYVISSPGIDVDFFSPKPPPHLSRSSRLQLLSIGRLEEAKGFEYLIKATALLKDALPLSLEIIGEGSYRERLESLIEELHLKQRVKLLGSLPHGPELQKKLRSADIFILPSIQDSEGVHDVHPNAVKEAMSTGVMVITTNLGGIDEFIRDNENGFLIDHADPELIAKAIADVASLTSVKKESLKTNARATIVRQYGADEITHELLQVFKHYAK